MLFSLPSDLKLVAPERFATRELRLNLTSQPARNGGDASEVEVVMLLSLQRSFSGCCSSLRRAAALTSTQQALVDDIQSFGRMPKRKRGTSADDRAETKLAERYKNLKKRDPLPEHISQTFRVLGVSAASGLTAWIRLGLLEFLCDALPAAILLRLLSPLQCELHCNVSLPAATLLRLLLITALGPAILFRLLLITAT